MSTSGVGGDLTTDSVRVMIYKAMVSHCDTHSLCLPTELCNISKRMADDKFIEWIRVGIAEGHVDMCCLEKYLNSSYIRATDDSRQLAKSQSVIPAVISNVSVSSKATRDGISRVAYQSGRKRSLESLSDTDTVSCKSTREDEDDEGHDIVPPVEHVMMKSTKRIVGIRYWSMILEVDNRKNCDGYPKNDISFVRSSDEWTLYVVGQYRTEGYRKNHYRRILIGTDSKWSGQDVRIRARKQFRAGQQYRPDTDYFNVSMPEGVNTPYSYFNMLADKMSDDQMRRVREMLATLTDFYKTEAVKMWNE